jgi:hypothetical protein
MTVEHAGTATVFDAAKTSSRASVTNYFPGAADGGVGLLTC